MLNCAALVISDQKGNTQLMGYKQQSEPQITNYITELRFP
jgi:hypothetical protein